MSITVNASSGGGYAAGIERGSMAMMSHNPVNGQCPACQATVTTAVNYKVGTCSWIWFLIICCFVCWYEIVCSVSNLKAAP